MNKHRDYIPAFHYHWLTPWYDAFMGWLYPERRLKSALLQQAALQPGQRILDLGCGTATLTLLIQQTQPAAQVTGLDVDAKVLAIAARKIRQAGADIALELGTATALPYADGTFDQVFACLMLHHLVREAKRRALGEILRVLKPGGELHVADFGQPHNRCMSMIASVIRRFEETADAIDGLLPVFMAEAGFALVEETAFIGTLSGTLRLHRARKPGGGLL